MCKMLPPYADETDEEYYLRCIAYYLCLIANSISQKEENVK